MDIDDSGHDVDMDELIDILYPVPPLEIKV